MQITNLKMLLEDESSSPSGQDIFLSSGSTIENRLLDRLYLTDEASELLAKGFVAHIDPIIRLIHVPSFLLSLNQFRRSVAPNSEQFEVELYALYGLGSLSLSEQDFVKIGIARADLLASCKRYVERGLARLKVTITHETSVLRTLLHFIVSTAHPQAASSIDAAGVDTDRPQTLMFWTGEMVHANSLLAVAVSIAYRLGVHRDGTHFNLPPFEAEMRKAALASHQASRLLVHRESGHGDACRCRSSRRNAAAELERCVLGCLPALFIHAEARGWLHGYDAGVDSIRDRELSNAVLKNGLPTEDTDGKEFFAFHHRLLEQSRENIQAKYLRHLDGNDIKQRLARDLAELSLNRIALTQRRMGAKCLKLQNQGDQKMSDYEKRYGRYSLACHEPRLMRVYMQSLFDESVEYCKKMQRLAKEYAPHNFGWAILHQFSWHSLATMLSTVLRHHSLSDTPEARSVRSKIANLFDDRLTIGYICSTNGLWKLTTQMCNELHFLDTFDKTMQQEALSLDSSMLGLGPYLGGPDFVAPIPPSENLEQGH